MNRRSRGWLSPRDDHGADLDALLAEAWDDGAAAARQVLDLQAGKAALLAACGQQQAVGTTASAAPGGPQKLALRAYRHHYHQQRRRTARAITAAGAVAALAAGAVTMAVVTGAFSSSSARQIHGPQFKTTAYVTRIEHALALSGQGNVLGYTRTEPPPGSIAEPVANGVQMQPGPGASSPWSVGSLVTWSYQGTRKVSAFTATGQRVFDTRTTGAAGRGKATVAVIYRDATWWRATYRAVQPVPSCGPGITIGPGGWPALIRHELGCGEYTPDGRQRVDGIDAIKLTGKGLGALWVNPATYLPVRALFTFGSEQSQTDFRWLSPTPANLAQLSAPVPAGFRQVPPPSAAAPR
jgi:hypothetical protein